MVKWKKTKKKKKSAEAARTLLFCGFGRFLQLTHICCASELFRPRCWFFPLLSSSSCFCARQAAAAPLDPVDLNQRLLVPIVLLFFFLLLLPLLLLLTSLRLSITCVKNDDRFHPKTGFFFVLSLTLLKSFKRMSWV